MHNEQKNCAHLIGARIGHVDDACSQLGLQVVDESRSEGLCLAYDILLITTTGHGQQKAEVTFTL